jgi:hypothetical protein
MLILGRQNMSVVATIVLGVIAAVVGGLLWEALFPGNDGIAWIGSVIVAAAADPLRPVSSAVAHATRRLCRAPVPALAPAAI